MKTLRTLFLPVLMITSLFAFATAFASAGEPVATTTDPFALYYPLVAALLGNFAFFVRNNTPTNGFWHTWYGHGALVLLGFIAGGLVPVFESGTVTKTALISALVCAGTSFASACKTGGKAPSSQVSTGPGPTITKAAIFVPLLFSLFGCAHLSPSTQTFDTAFGSCMEQHGLLAAPGIGQQVWNDLNNGANKNTIIAQLEALAGKVGEDAVTCAVTSWLNDPPATGVKAEKNPIGVQAANAFLAKRAARTKQ